MIPRTWLIIGAAGLLVVTNAGSVLVTRSYYLNAWEAEKANASRVVLEETARIEAERAKDVAAKDDRIRTLETEHEAEREKNRTAAANAERGYNDRLRRIASSCHNRVVPSGGDAPGVSEAIAAERDRLRERIGQRIARLGEAGNELALRDKLCVRSWAEVAR